MSLKLTHYRKICKSCPNSGPCLDEALARRESEGMWGGLTPQERKQLLRRRNRNGVLPHGVDATYSHLGCRCRPCTDAHTRAQSVRAQSREAS